MVVKFQVAGSMSTKDNHVIEDFQKFIDKHRGKNKDRKYVFIPCFSLHSILKGL